MSTCATKICKQCRVRKTYPDDFVFYRVTRGVPQYRNFCKECDKMKTCKRCGMSKHKTDFRTVTKKTGATNAYTYCRDCEPIIKKEGRRKRPRKEMPDLDGTQECRICHLVKHFSEFHKGESRTGYRKECKACSSAHSKEHRATKAFKKPPPFRECYICHQVKSIDQYSANSCQSDNKERRCKACVAVIVREHAHSVVSVKPKFKECYHCHEVKPAAEFDEQNKNKCGLRAPCKQCRKKKSVAEAARQILQKEESKCVFCEEADWRLLQFDHIDPSTKAVSKNGRTISICDLSSIKKFLEELPKCQIACNFCHGLKTQEDQQESMPPDNESTKSARSLRRMREANHQLFIDPEKLNRGKCAFCSRLVTPETLRSFYFVYLQNKEDTIAGMCARQRLSTATFEPAVTNCIMLCANCFHLKQIRGKHMTNDERAEFDQLFSSSSQEP